MKTKFLTLLVIFAIACSKKEEAPVPAYSFKNQDVSGKINNVAWAYADGYADVTSGTDPKVDVKLLLTQSNKGCAITNATGNQVFFRLPAKVGLYTINFDLTGSTTSYTATLFEKATTLNIIANSGAIEILTLTNTEVTGRMDARSDDKSFVNGNFKVAICP
jgi:hypothetical protein